MPGALNGLYKALSDLLCTPEVSQELCDLNAELCKVSLASGFPACRVFWRATSLRPSTHTRGRPAKSAAHMGHLLMSQQTPRNVLPKVFVQDKKYAAMMEIYRLLAIADFGPRDDKTL